MPFDRGLLEGLFQNVLAALRKRDQPTQDVVRLSRAVAESPELLERLVPKASFGPDKECLAALAGRLEIASELLLFIGRVLSAPFVTDAVRRLRQSSLEVPKASGSCPWCGSLPGLAKLKRKAGEEGKRILFCSLCGESWDVARLACPFCGNQEALGLLSVEGTGPHAIETCDQCRGYLKTVDERKLPEEQTVVPLVETTGTLYLDLIAETQGYARGLPYAALR